MILLLLPSQGFGTEEEEEVVPRRIQKVIKKKSVSIVNPTTILPALCIHISYKMVDEYKLLKLTFYNFLRSFWGRMYLFFALEKIPNFLWRFG